MKGLALAKLVVAAAAGKEVRHDSIKAIDEWVSIPAYCLSRCSYRWYGRKGT
jgi:hypothetical protein